MAASLRLGAGSGFWGDAIDPALELLAHGELDYLGMDYLAELTMALLQRLRKKSVNAGYIPDMPEHLRQLLPLAHLIQHGAIGQGKSQPCLCIVSQQAQTHTHARDGYVHALDHAARGCTVVGWKA